MRNNPYDKADPSAHMGATEGGAESEQTRVVREFKQLCIKDAREQANAGCAVARPNPRHLIEERIEYHNRQARLFCALLRGLPQEMSVEAEEGLASFILNARSRW